MQDEITNIANNLPSYFLVMVRISSALMSDVIFGRAFVPARYKIFLSMLLTVIILPTLDLSVSQTSLSYFLLLEQILIGVAMGTIVQLMFHITIIGGGLVAYQAGLGFAKLIDPSHKDNLNLISEIYFIAAILLFLTQNGHLKVIEIIVSSFNTIPVTPEAIQHVSLEQIAQFGSQMFSGGLSIALPTVIALLIVNTTFAVMTRTTPQLNIFSIGFPITLLLGLFLIFLTFNGVLGNIQQQFSDGLNTLQTIVTGGANGR